MTNAPGAIKRKLPSDYLRSPLNIPRYVDTFEEEAVIDIDAVQEEIEQLESELVTERAKMATMATMLKEIER